MDALNVWREVKQLREATLNGTYVDNDNAQQLPADLVERVKKTRKFMRHPLTTDTPTLRVAKWNAEGKYIHLCDLHVPYVNMSLIDKVLRTDADGVIINGDLFDAERLSPFSSRKHVPFSEEYDIALEIVSNLAKKFKTVILIPGNHERRFSRVLFSELVNSEFSIFMQSDPMYYIARGNKWLDGYEVSNPLFENVIYFDNAVLLGDVIFDHPSNFLSTPGGTVRKVIRHFLSGTELPFKYVVIGHTHKSAEVTEHGKIGIEAGCACIDLPYQFVSGRRNGGDSVNMFLILEFHDNHLTNYTKVFHEYRQTLALIQKVGDAG